MRKCWPEKMESGLVCLFWLRGCPPQAPLLGGGGEGCRGINGGKEGKIRKMNASTIVKVSTQVKPDSCCAQKWMHSQNWLTVVIMAGNLKQQGQYWLSEEKLEPVDDSRRF